MATKRMDEYTAKTTLVSADLILIADSAALVGGNPSYKKITWSNLETQILAAAGGDVVGPAGSTDNTIPRFDSTTGKLLQTSLVTIDNSGTINIPTGEEYQINGTALALSDLLATPLTTKGDILVYSTALARLAVGTNGQYLIADSTQTEGIKWASLLSTSSTSFVINSGGNQLILDSTGLTGNRTFTFPDASDEVVGLTASQILTTKTLTSPVLNTQVTGTAVLDDDSFATATALTLATSESIKTYVDDNTENITIINSESDFPLSGAGTEYELTNGTYKLNQSISLTKVITIDTAATSVLITTANPAFTLTNTLSSAMFQCTDLIASFRLLDLFIISASGDVFDIANPTGGGNVVLEASILNNCTDLGTIQDCGAIFEFSALVDVGQGIVLNDNSRVSLSKVTCISWKNEVSCEYFGFTGTHADIKINHLFVATAGANESIYSFDSAMTLDSAQLNGNSHDISAGGSIFASGSKDQSSTYFDCKQNLGIADSEVSAGAFLVGNSTATVIPAVDAAVIVNGSTGFTSDALERITLSNTGHLQYTGSENATLMLDGNITMEPATATKDLSARFYCINSVDYTVTFTNGTNTINETSTALSDGDRISFKNTPGTLPAELREDIIYYVVSKATNSFQVSYTSGGAAVAFTDDGTPTNNYSVSVAHGSQPLQPIASGAARDLVVQALIQLSTDCEIVLCVSNESDGVDITATNIYMRVKK